MKYSCPNQLPNEATANKQYYIKFNTFLSPTLRPNESHLSTDQSGMISNCQMILKKLKYGDIDASDIFIVSTEYEAVTQDIGQIPALRHAMFKELKETEKTDR